MGARGRPCAAHGGAYWGMAMEHAIVSLESPGTDWAGLVRFVERSGQPLWLEADGEIRGVLLPTGEARLLLGRWSVPRRPHGGAHAPWAGDSAPRDPCCVCADPTATP